MVSQERSHEKDAWKAKFPTDVKNEIQDWLDSRPTNNQLKNFVVFLSYLYVKFCFKNLGEKARKIRRGNFKGMGKSC